MIQRILSLALLLGVILWLVLSYIPDSLLPLPAVGYPGSGSILAGLAVAGAAAFLAVQVLLVRSTARSINPDHQRDAGRPPLRLNQRVEIFWTALPLAMTLVLAWASYALWSNLTQH